MPRIDHEPLRAVLRSLTIDRVDFVGAGSNGESDIVMFKARKGAPTTGGIPMADTSTTDADLAALAAVIDEAVTKAVADAETAAKAAHDQFVAALDALASAGADDTEDVTKGLAPEVAAAFAKERDERAALEAEVAKMRDAEATRVFKARAAELPLVGSVDEVADVLKSVASVDAKAAATLDTLLTAVNERLAKSGLLAEVGGAPSDATGDPASRLVAKTAEVKASDPSLTDDEAMAKAVAADPTLYDAYRATFR